MDDEGGFLSIRIIDSEEDFINLEDDWNRLVSESTDPSFFSTFYFVRTAWQHYAKESDSLFILVFQREEKIVAIAPFRIRVQRQRGCKISIRVIRFIDWDGDRPRLVTLEKEEIIWGKIYQFLKNEFKQWDMINLMEQSTDSAILRQGFFNNKRYFSKFGLETISYYISTQGTWEEYIKNRKRKVKENLRRRKKMLCLLSKDVSLECFENTKTIGEALNRYCSVEQSGWKKGASFSIGGIEGNRKFYESLIMNLVRNNMVSIYLLKYGEEDIAGKIIFKCKNISYSVQTAYRPSYSKYSPGTLLLVEIIKSLLENECKELDLLGMQRENERQNSKRDWATGVRETVRIRIYKISCRLILYAMAMRQKTFSKKLRQRMRAVNLRQQFSKAK